jgi:hypothetical protein
MPAATHATFRINLILDIVFPSLFVRRAQKIAVSIPQRILFLADFGRKSTVGLQSPPLLK